jgi:hypothetical protein
VLGGNVGDGVQGEQGGQGLGRGVVELDPPGLSAGLRCQTSYQVTYDWGPNEL